MAEDDETKDRRAFRRAKFEAKVSHDARTLAASRKRGCKVEAVRKCQSENFPALRARLNRSAAKQPVKASALTSVARFCGL